MPDPVVTTAGYYNGVLDVYYALMTGADSAAAKPTYGTPAIMGKSIEVTITPQYAEGSLYASNRAVRRENRIDRYDVSLNLDQVLPAVRQAVLGRTVDSNGVEMIAGGNEIPYVAILFAVTLDDGTKELWCLYKGKFQEMEKSAQTANDSIEYQTPTLDGTFDRRIFDDKLAAVANTGTGGVSDAIANAWFTSVYETPASNAQG